MAFYIVAEANVRDQEGFKENFASVALQIFKECHGQLLARGYDNAIHVSGAPPEVNVLLASFPDLDLTQEYLKKIEPLIEKVGKKYADFRIIVVEGLPIGLGRQTT